MFDVETGPVWAKLTDFYVRVCDEGFHGHDDNEGGEE